MCVCFFFTPVSSPLFHQFEQESPLKGNKNRAYYPASIYLLFATFRRGAAKIYFKTLPADFRVYLSGLHVIHCRTYNLDTLI